MSKKTSLPIFPFSAIIGQEEMKLALQLNVIDPKIGGVMIMGDRGTGKSTTIRAIADLLPKIDIVKNDPFNSHPTDLELMSSDVLLRYRNNEKLMDTDSVYFAKVPGNYFAQLTNQGNCMFNTTSVNVTQDNCAKLNDYSFENKIIVFPNPTKELLTISGKVNEKLRIELINSLGQIVSKCSFSSFINNQEVDMSKLAAGVYMLKFSNQKGTKTFKVIKQ